MKGVEYWIENANKSKKRFANVLRLYGLVDRS